MNCIADAIVYAVVYINSRDCGDDGLDDDVGALESIAACLADATDEEHDALAAAAKRALEGELSFPSPRPDFVQDYSRWMEEMFGDDWVGNERS